MRNVKAVPNWKSLGLVLVLTGLGCASGDAGDDPDGEEATAAGGQATGSAASAPGGATSTGNGSAGGGAAGRGGAAGIGSGGTAQAGEGAPSGVSSPVMSGGSDSTAAGQSSMSTADPGLVDATLLAHNAVRSDLGIPDLTWSDELAALALDWASTLTENCSFDAIGHRPPAGVGENIAAWASSGSLRGSTATPVSEAVANWAAEVECWSYGNFMRGDACDTACIQSQNSSGCGHYTQLVWRNTREVGCGYASCTQPGGALQEVWVCNYSPQGNVIGQQPY